MEIETVDARNERLWQKYLSLLEKQPTLRLASYLRMARVGLHGFERCVSVMPSSTFFVFAVNLKSLLRHHLFPFA